MDHHYKIVLVIEKYNIEDKYIRIEKGFGKKI